MGNVKQKLHNWCKLMQAIVFVKHRKFCKNDFIEISFRGHQLYLRQPATPNCTSSQKSLLDNH